MFEAAKLVAAQRVRNPGLLDVLRQWAEEKYKLPWSHECFQDQTIFDLLIAFWEDYYQRNKMEARRRPDGEVMFETGDPLIDKWEKELAMGLVPDLFEGLPTKDRAVWRKEQERKQRHVKDSSDVTPSLEGFSDSYGPSTSASAKLPTLGKRPAR